MLSQLMFVQNSINIYQNIMTENTSGFEPLQLIDQKKQFNSQSLEKTIKSLGDCGKNYFTVAIVGAQNSGKSTLLNTLFGTDFKVLSGVAGHRTTQGVVLGRDKESNLIIMDVEGNDSYESHLEGDDNYERMVGSFALVGANILLVNIFEKQLGQRKGSQYQTLSTVMRICIDQFKQESPKTILFVLRDSYTEQVGQREVKSKIQKDVEQVWKSVWTGTKITPEMEKYQSNPERFFTLQVAFLRYFDSDYPEQFQEDVRKLRQRFVDPQCPGYLFKRQNQEHNLPISDITQLLSKIWTLLTTNKELNLPNEKVQLANYRCEQVVTQIQIRDKFEIDIASKASIVRNYGAVLQEISIEFRKATSSYGKAVTDKWEQQLLEGLRPKIRTVVLSLIQHEQKQFQDQFVKAIDQLFYDPNTSFKTQSLELQKTITQKQLQMFKEINFQIPKRKERIQSLSNRLDELSKTEVKHKLQWTQQQFQNEGQRAMKLVAAVAFKQYFGMQFWYHLGNLFRDRKKQLFEQLESRMRWARGSGPTGDDLNSAEQRLMEWLKQQVKVQFQRGLANKLFTYFKNNFQADQHGMRYDYKLLSQDTVVERFTEAKEMALDLLKRINNMTLSLSRYTSFIDVQEDPDNPTYNPFLEAGTVLSIREGLERRASEEFSNVMRRKNEARMKKTPLYLIALIGFFIYDDLWFTSEESPFMHYLLTILIVLTLIPFALGQGIILQQFANLIAEKIGCFLTGIWSKIRTRSEKQSDNVGQTGDQGEKSKSS